MTTKQQSTRCTSAVDGLARHCPQLEAHRVVNSLSAGLSTLRDLLMVRALDDVDRTCAADSMEIPSLARLQRQVRKARLEIEAYSCIVAADEVGLTGFVEQSDPWFLDWIFRLRFGDACQAFQQKRVRYYRSETIEARRLKFVSELQRCLPRSVKAPLLLFRMYPRSVRIATAIAFDSPLRAQELRNEQIGFLPAITDCHECHGRVLDNEEICRCCGNPIWRFSWLLSD